MERNVQLDPEHVSPPVWHMLFAQQAREVATVLLACVVLLLALAICVLLWRGGAVHFVALGTGMQAARPGEVPQKALTDVALHTVATLGNVTPEGIANASEHVKTLMTGPFRIVFAQRIAMQEATMREHDIVTLTDQLRVSQIEKVPGTDRPTYRVSVQGVRVLWVGVVQLAPEPLTVTLELVAVISEQPDLAGLWIHDMVWPAPSIRSQEIAAALAKQTRRRGQN